MYEHIKVVGGGVDAVGDTDGGGEMEGSGGAGSRDGAGTICCLFQRKLYVFFAPS